MQGFFYFKVEINLSQIRIHHSMLKMNFRGALPSILGLLKAFQWNLVGFIHRYELEFRDVIAGLEQSDRGEICIEFTEQSIFDGRKLIDKISSSKSNVTLVMDESALYYMSRAGQEENRTMEKHIIHCCYGVTFGLAGLEYKVFQGVWSLHQRPRLVPGFLDYLLDTNTHRSANATVGYLFRKVCHQCTANPSSEHPCRNFNNPVPVNTSAARLSHHEQDICLGAPAINMCNLCLDRLAYLDVIFIMDLFTQKLARAIEERSQNCPPSQPQNSSDFNGEQLEQFLIDHYSPLLPINPNPFEVFYWNVTDDGEVKLPQLDVDVQRAASDSYDPVARTVGLRGGGAIRILPSHCSRGCGQGEVQKLHPDLPQHCCYACEVCSPGTYSNGSALESCWSCPQDEWSHGGQASCWKKAVVYLFWSEPTSVVLIMLTLVGMALTVSVTALYVKHIDTPIGKAAGGPIFYCHMASLLGSFASVFLFVGEPTGWKCKLRWPAFGVSFTLCLASILAKCVRILAAFATPVGRPTKLQRSLYLIVLGILPTLQCIICFLWLLLDSPGVRHSYPRKADYLVIECFNETGIGFSFSMGYLCALAFCCLTAAIKTHSLPKIFSDSQGISLMMVTFFAVWLSVMPALESGKEQMVDMVAVVSILLSSYSGLAFLFFQRCYVMLFRPHRNTTEWIKKTTYAYCQKVASKANLIIQLDRSTTTTDMST
ncbi:unnamed protein product [Caretta caretta]